MNDSWVDEDLGRRLKKEGNEIPQLVSIRVNETLAALPVKRRLWRKTGYAALAVCVAFGCFIGISLVNSDMARAVRSLPVIGSVFERLGDAGIRHAGEAGLSSSSNETAEDQGIAMTITEVLYDGIRLSVGYVIEGGGDIRPERPELYANGKSFNFSSGARGHEVEAGIYAGLIDYKPSEQLSDQFTLKLKYSKMQDWDHKKDAIPQTIEGAWTFEIPVKKLTEGILTKAFTDNDAPNIQSGDTSLIARKITLSPTITSVEVDMTEPIKLADSLFHEKMFQLLDDRGVVLQYLGATSSSQSKDGDKLRLTEYRLEYAPLHYTPEYLIVRPIVAGYATGDYEPVYHTASLGEQNLPIRLSQGEAGTLTVSQISFNEDDTKLYYTIKGSNPYEQAYSVWIEDESGNQYKDTLPQLIKTEPGQYSFVMKLPVINEQTRLTLFTMETKTPRINKQLELKIPIQ